MASPIYLLLIGAVLLSATISAEGQGIYMGRDGRAHAQVIVGPDGTGWPVAPTFCTPGFGPCPVITGPPLAYAPLPPPPGAPPPLEPQPVEPVPYAQPAAPPPLGFVWGQYTACIEADCRSVIVSTGVDGLNVRVAPNGPIVLTLANGTPVIPLRREGPWLLVAAACPLVPTFTASVTAGGIPLSVCA
jgi:hypothetical protein